jgi:NAD(P)-dependent dehydrogenase (short-subunit alcohol dehydrogenase family)
MSVKEKFDLTDKVAIVTGAAMGLGKAMATGLAQEGAKIVIADVNIEAAEKAAEEIRKENVEVFVIKTDVTNSEDIDNLVDAVMKKFKRIDILFNNAGICIHQKAEEMSYENWLKVMNVNLNSIFLMSQKIGKIMIGQKKGVIVNTASMSGLIVNTPQCQCSYNASKAGVIQLTKSLASEWAQYNIRVNAIAPGYMKTELTKPYFEDNGEMVKKWMDMSPMHRPGEPEELMGIAVYLASDASTFVTGSVFVVDGGYTIW